MERPGNNEVEAVGNRPILFIAPDSSQTSLPHKRAETSADPGLLLEQSLKKLNHFHEKALQKRQQRSARWQSAFKIRIEGCTLILGKTDFPRISEVNERLHLVLLRRDKRFLENLGVEDFLIRREILEWICWVVIGRDLPEELIANIMIYCEKGAEGWLSYLCEYSLVMGS